MHSKASSGRRRGIEGLVVRHSRSCAIADGERCTCKPSYRAQVYDSRTGQKIRKTFAGAGAFAAAKQWRADALSDLGKGQLKVPTRRTVYELAEEWLAGAKADPPVITTRSGRRYKPSVLRGYESDLTRYVYPDFAGARISDVRRADVQAFVDRLVGQGHSGSKVRNVCVALGVVFRYAVRRDLVTSNPTMDLDIPSGTGSRDRAASPVEAAALLAALPADLRPLYATAFYAGLRRGELRGLRWEDVDLAKGEIRVRRSWDDVAGAVPPKSEKGTRTVPMLASLRDYLMEQKSRTRGEEDDFAFPAPRGGAFTPSQVRRRAEKAWRIANEERVKAGRGRLVPIGLHECRHTCVSTFHAAGVPLERIGDYVGHSSAYMTDRYRHLIDGQREEDARLVDDYLARGNTALRIEQLDPS